MRLHDTVLRMREILIANGVYLTPDLADAEKVYQGRGVGAQAAWKAFLTVAAEPAFDPIDAWGEGTFEPVNHAGFAFDAGLAPEFPGRRGEPGRPEQYWLNFTRQFSIGNAGDMMGLQLSIILPAADELRALEAGIWGSDDRAPDALPAIANAWGNEVEASDAFAIPMTRHQADRFQFGVDRIG